MYVPKEENVLNQPYPPSPPPLSSTTTTNKQTNNQAIAASADSIITAFLDPNPSTSMAGKLSSTSSPINKLDADPTVQEFAAAAAMQAANAVAPPAGLEEAAASVTVPRMQKLPWPGGWLGVVYCVVSVCSGCFF